MAIITRPGKFEGEQDYMPAAYQAYLEGGGRENDDDSVTVEIPNGDGWREVTFVVTEQGFVEEV